MAKLPTDEFFINFPRMKLTIPIARRAFFSALIETSVAISRKNEGECVTNLAGLGISPDDELENIIPTIMTDAEISTKNEILVGKSAQTGKSYQLFSVNSPAMDIFNQFNGENTLLEISKNQAKRCSWDKSKCFAYVRGVFLTLVVAGLCTPKF